ncbi:MAG: TolC family protein [Candidatus Obscuribacterales bacterium]|nr:TolC family protein [Candidatus Obscuribacterales bacterium]
MNSSRNMQMPGAPLVVRAALLICLSLNPISAFAASGPIFEQVPPGSPIGTPPELRPTAPDRPAGESLNLDTTPSTAIYALKAENTVNLTLKSAFAQADEHNPEILKAKQDVAIAEANIVSAGAIPNPQLATQLGFGPAWTKTIAGNTQQVGINQIVETGGKRAARLKLARSQKTASTLQLESIRFELRTRIRRVYAELAAAQEYAGLVERQRALTERLVNIAIERFKAGSAPEAEIFQSKLNLNQYDAQRNTAQGRIRQAQIQLSTLLGEPVAPNLMAIDQGLFDSEDANNDLVPAPDKPFPDEGLLLQSALNARPDLMVAKQQLNVSARQLGLVKAQRIPDVILGSGFVFTTFQAPEKQQYGAYLNVNVDLPIFYRKQGEIMAARLSQDQAKTQSLIVQNRVTAEIKAAYENVRLSRANISKYRTQLLAAAAETVRLAELGYKYGRNRLSDVILSQQSAQQINVGYFDAVVSYQNAWADLEKSVGRPLDL